MGTVERKIPGGKLLRVDVTIRAQVISNVKITGDFFLHPEELIDSIESLFTDIKIDFDVDKLRHQTEALLFSKGGELIGISPEDIVECVAAAIEEEV